MKRILLKIIIALAALAGMQLNASGQGRATVSGYITDAKTGETLISAGVVAQA